MSLPGSLRSQRLRPLGIFGQSQQLVERFFVAQQLSLDELLASRPQLHRIQLHPTHGRGVGVVAQSLSVGDGRQEQVEGPRRVFTAVEVAMADQVLIDPAELAGQVAEPIGSEEFFDHAIKGDLPTPCRECRTLWLADGGRYPLCPLVTWNGLTWR